MLQSCGEPDNCYIKIFKSQVSKCDFLVKIKPRTLLCRVVFNILCIKMRVLRGNTITFERTINEIRAAEMTKGHMVFIAEGDKSDATKKLSCNPWNF